MEFIIVLILIIVFNVVALRWGFKGGDGWCNPEYKSQHIFRGSSDVWGYQQITLPAVRKSTDNHS